MLRCFDCQVAESKSPWLTAFLDYLLPEHSAFFNGKPWNWNGRTGADAVKCKRKSTYRGLAPKFSVRERRHTVMKAIRQAGRKPGSFFPIRNLPSFDKCFFDTNTFRFSESELPDLKTCPTRKCPIISGREIAI